MVTGAYDMSSCGTVVEWDMRSPRMLLHTIHLISSFAGLRLASGSVDVDSQTCLVQRFDGPHCSCVCTIVLLLLRIVLRQQQPTPLLISSIAPVAAPGITRQQQCIACISFACTGRCCVSVSRQALAAAALAKRCRQCAGRAAKLSCNCCTSSKSCGLSKQCVCVCVLILVCACVSQLLCAMS